MGCVESKRATLDGKSIATFAGDKTLVLEVYANRVTWNSAHTFTGVSENELVGDSVDDLFGLSTADEIRRVSVFTHELHGVRYRFRWNVYFPNIYVGVCLSQADQRAEEDASVEKYAALMSDYRVKYLEHIPPHMFEPFRLLVMLADSMSKRLGDTRAQDVLCDVVNAVRSQEQDPVVTQSLTSVEQVFSEVVSRTRDLFDSIKFTTEVHGVEEQATYVMDRRSVVTVLYNLLNNASKFTPDGGAVRLTVRRQESRSYRHVLTFCVEDSGPGLPDDIVSELCGVEKKTNTFMRTRSATQILCDPHTSMGIGLITSSHLLKAMNARLHCGVSELGGARIEFTLYLTPFDTSPAPDRRRMPSVELAPRIHNLRADCAVMLVCSDDMRTNDLVTTLHTFGLRDITVAQTGEEAIRRVLSKEERSIEIALIDYMTDMSSTSLMMILRELSDTNCYMLSDKPVKDDPSVVDRTSLQSIATVFSNYFETS